MNPNPKIYWINENQYHEKIADIARAIVAAGELREPGNGRSVTNAWRVLIDVLQVLELAIHTSPRAMK